MVQVWAFLFDLFLTQVLTHMVLISMNNWISIAFVDSGFQEHWSYSPPSPSFFPSADLDEKTDLVEVLSRRVEELQRGTYNIQDSHSLIN